MHQFELTPDLITGVAEIDAQHRALFGLANEVLEASDLEANPAPFQRAVAFLASYTIHHFAAEEAAMAESGYPGARFHMEFHDRLRRECAAIVARTKREGVRKEIKLSISFMLEDWLIYHIRETDRELAGFLRDHSPGATIPHLPDVRTVRESEVIPAGLDESTFEAVVGRR
jgi:hemerythrin